MKNKIKNPNYIFALLSIVVLLFGGYLCPMQEKTLFNINEIGTWDESGFATKDMAHMPDSEGGHGIIKIGPNSSNYNYGSLQKKVSQNWESYRGGEVSLIIKSEKKELEKVRLYLGEIVSGPNQKNRNIYASSFNSRGEWQEIKFDLKEPTEKKGNLNYRDIQRIRINFEYNLEEIGEEDFSILIKDIKVSHYSTMSKILILMSLILISITLTNFKYFKENKKDGLRKLILSLFFFLCISLLISEIDIWIPLNKDFLFYGGITVGGAYILAYFKDEK